MNFGERLRSARIAKGYTQEKLASMVGVAKSTLTGYEKGNREPDVEKIIALAKALDITGDELLGISQDDPRGNEKATLQEMESGFEALFNSWGVKPDAISPAKAELIKNVLRNILESEVQ